MQRNHDTVIIIMPLLVVSDDIYVYYNNAHGRKNVNARYVLKMFLRHMHELQDGNTMSDRVDYKMSRTNESIIK